ncbi:polyketide synthase dehydratase domain-containing protein [Streptomyces sp. APSN-46.1]|uniref:type I polyketide synthase n=1 Tax=Streptomyces sp. APSN-46.1 TaxID=2929049 RepID=UPI001FB43F27|nr:type I polyketide synthase [Streptomyces sp. APSN-46.1]MCJ1676418.1 polyketide synthase dehydratase domain-containing protein [Streptomyces sp. APSN-46.1]
MSERQRRGGPRPTDAAIVGMGAVFPGAADLAGYRRNLLAGTDSIGEVPPNRWDPDVYYDPDGAGGPASGDRFYCRRGGFVDGLAAFDPTRFGIMPAAVEGAEPDQMLALHATAEALADAGGEDRLPADRSRIGVVLGRGGFMGVATARLDQRVRTAHQLAHTLRELAPELGERRISQVRSAFQEALGPERPDASIGLVPSFTAARTANRLDFRGPAYTLDAACASSLLAVDQAVGLLASGRCDAVVAGAVHHCHIATLWSVFTQLRALSPSERIRPFDRRADGTLLSEGTGVVLLKRLADAERDGDRVYAVIRGTGVAGDGRAASLMSPLVAGQVRALERAWREAGLDPRSPGALGLLEAHGTGTPVGDTAELDTLAQVFGPPERGDARGIGFGSVKSMLGHTMQASGMAGLIKAALAVHEGVLPPTLHLEEPHPDLVRTRMRPLAAAEPWERGPAPLRAGVNAFGFGGINAHVVLEEAPAAARPTAPTRRFLPLGAGAAPVGPASAREDVLLLAADSPERLSARLSDQLASGAPVSGGDGPCRLAVVGPTPQRLALAAKAVARGRAWRGRGDVWFAPEPLGGRTAFLFPGLEPEFAPVVDDVADRLGLARPPLTRGSSLVERALDAIATGRFFAEVLPGLGIEAEVLAGHSLGEWAAMVAAGMYPREAADTFLASLRPGDLLVPDLVYAALGCGARRAEAALHGLDRVVVSHDNCPHQSVICGDPGQVASVVARLRADGVLGQELPFRSGFHTPMWEPYLGQVRAAFERLPPRAGSLPVWSATTCAPFPSAPGDVRELVVRHLLEPVRFRELILRLYEDEGVRSFVTLGPGSLPGFVEDTLREHPHLSVAASSPRLGGLAALRRACAALWAEGHAPRWDRLAGAGTAAGAAAPSAAPAAGRRGPRAAPTGPGPSSSPGRGSGPGTGRGMPLDLGSPLVRLGESARASLTGLLTPNPPSPQGLPSAQGLPSLPSAPNLPNPPSPQGLPSPQTPPNPPNPQDVPSAQGLPSPPSAQSPPSPPTLPSPQGPPSPPSLPSPPSPPTLPSPPSLETPQAPPTPAEPAGPRPVLLSALDAVLADTGAAARSVTEAWSAVRPPDAAVPAEPAHHGAGRATGKELLRLSLAALPSVRDHCVYLQPDGWPEDSDRFPVVPMTTMLELAAEAALRYAPPGLAVIGYEDVRALRWLAVEPAVDVEVTVRGDGPGRTRVALGEYASVVVLLGPRYGEPPAPDPTSLRDPEPAPVSAEALYRDRWMFHGPRFAGVHEVRSVGADGIAGVLRALPDPGALLDAAGQLFGHWMQLRLPVDRLVFPATVDRVRFFGPPPAPRELVAATARIREVRAVTVRGDIELRRATGEVWARIEGWTYRRFGADERVWPMKFTPEVCGIGEPRPEGWCLARRRWSDPASRELVMRRYLGAAERAAYERLSPRARDPWLLGRIAAKDALRQALWDAGAGPVFPVEVPIGNDPAGRPLARGPLTGGLRLSIAHKDRIAVALAHPSRAVGIDVEPVTADPDALVRIALGPDEIRLAEGLAVREGTGLPAALTALWCAKEAAAKAEGTGLGGRPRAWRVTEDAESPDCGGLSVRSPDGRTYPVRTTLLTLAPLDHVVAWTVGPAAASPVPFPLTEARHGT